MLIYPKNGTGAPISPPKNPYEAGVIRQTDKGGRDNKTRVLSKVKLTTGSVTVLMAFVSQRYMKMKQPPFYEIGQGLPLGRSKSKYSCMNSTRLWTLK